MCNGGGRDNCKFKYKPHLGRRMTHLGKMIASTWTRVVDTLKEGHNQKRTRTTQALTSNEICPSKFTVKCDLLRFHITVLEKNGCGCPDHENHLKGDLSKCSLPPMQLIPKKEKEIIRSMLDDACTIGAAVERNYIFALSPNLASSSQRLK
jgi:hypothetical protein